MVIVLVGSGHVEHPRPVRSRSTREKSAWQPTNPGCRAGSVGGERDAEHDFSRATIDDTSIRARPVGSIPRTEEGKVTRPVTEAEASEQLGMRGQGRGREDNRR